LRAPYGAKSSPIEAFSFEEMPEPNCHECFLWGNAAFVKAEQLARAFAESHWDMRPAEASQTDRLPMYYYDDEGETVLMACAEIYLTEKGGNRLSNQGLMAVWSVRNMDAVRSSDFGSLATGNNLRGRWAG
jgi:type VI secretion system protein ImpC